jgi:uncharacterized membrane protein
MFGPIWTRWGEVMLVNNVNQRVDAIVDDLSREFANQIERKQVEDRVMRVYGRLSKARIQQFVPVLTRRIARKELLRAM